MSDRSTLFNAAIGGVVTVVTAFLPLSPVIGGATAGYLERDDGIRLGALSGAIAAVPLVLAVLAAGFLFALLDVTPAAGLLPFALVIAALVLTGLYTVGFGALGGLVGVYLADEFA
jgi:hypothetical protein